MFTLQSGEIEDAWGWIGKFIEKVPDDEWTADGVKKDLMGAKAQLWCVIGSQSEVKGILITRIENYYEKRYGLIWIASGSGIESGVQALEIIERWFKEMGCAFVQIVGRKGWGRILDGYHERARIYAKDLT